MVNRLKEIRNWTIVTGVLLIPPALFGYGVDVVTDNALIGTAAGVIGLIGWSKLLLQPEPNAHMPDGWTPYGKPQTQRRKTSKS